MLTGLQKNLRFFKIRKSRTQIRHIQRELSSPSPTYQHHMLKMNLMAEKKSISSDNSQKYTSVKLF